MDFLKDAFKDGAITWEQFSKFVTDGKFKIADLSTGNYVDKNKHEAALSAKDESITELTNQISARDTDIKTLQGQLEDNKDNNVKITELNDKLTQMTNDYATQKQTYEDKLQAQSYNFAVREFVNTKQFTSQAAKRDFTNEMIKQNLQMKDNTILGAEDFTNKYMESNKDAFVVETKQDEKPPAPNFVNPGNTNTNTGKDNVFSNVFHFNGVRPRE